MSSVTFMYAMFQGANIFNQPLDSWDTSSVISMGYMFRDATSFNRPLNTWSTGNVTTMTNMLQNASSFNQSLSAWDITGINSTTSLNFFLQNVTIDTANYDAILISWAAQTPLFNGVTPDFGNSQYTLGGAAESARNTLINTYGWTITDGGGI